MQDKYRALFITPLGLEVLTDILFKLDFGCTLDPNDTQKICQHNIAIDILANCGMFVDLKKSVIALANVPTKQEEKMEDDISFEIK